MAKKLTMNDFRVLPGNKIYIRGEDQVVTTPKGHIALEKALRIASKTRCAEEFLNNPTIKGCFIETKPTYREALPAEVEVYERLKAVRLNDGIEEALKTKHAHEARIASEEKCIKRTLDAVELKKRSIVRMRSSQDKLERNIEKMQEELEGLRLKGLATQVTKA